MRRNVELHFCPRLVFHWLYLSTFMKWCHIRKTPKSYWLIITPKIYFFTFLWGNYSDYAYSPGYASDSRHSSWDLQHPSQAEVPTATDGKFSSWQRAETQELKPNAIKLKIFFEQEVCHIHSHSICQNQSSNQVYPLWEKDVWGGLGGSICWIRIYSITLAKLPESHQVQNLGWLRQLTLS